ncbi:hypothetical protein POM88_037807 [Heracleum sosnowskyi]|uniref:Uncharacterized protein n=1 Tax=Heracleum sosnowskyi TaxID=360622 RepID=A0AAD8MDL9_9APIA|nr:hypothetical protein POM88_037807 [Heracleum sosnowskyi]
MRRDFRTYVGSVVRFQVDINVESWDVVNDGLKYAIWDDIKNRWKLDDSHKKNVLERAGKQWRDFKGYYFPNEKTKVVFEKMGELQNQVSDGSWTPQGHDDILSRALGRKEHGGRARGNAYDQVCHGSQNG